MLGFDQSLDKSIAQEKGGEAEVYSPQIWDDLIPPIYRAAKEDGVPMTVWVSRVLAIALKKRAARNRAPKERCLGVPILAINLKEKKGGADVLALESSVDRASG